RQGSDPRGTGNERPDLYERHPKRRPDPSRTTDPRRAYDAYGRPGQGTRPPGTSYEKTTEPHRERPRQARDFGEQRSSYRRDTPGPYEEVDERYQQRRRISGQSRSDAYGRPLQPTYPEEDVYSNRRPPQRNRRTWSTLLIGCIGGIVTVLLILGIIAFIFLRTLPISLGGIIGSKSSFTKQVQQVLSISTATRQLQVHNSVGNLSILVDSTATQATLSAVEKVQASSSSDANKEFGRISVSAKTGSDPSILTVNATVPGTSGGLLAGASDSVEMTIVLPPSAVSNNPTSPFTISAGVASTGDLSVQNFNGLLNLTGNMGSISVQHGLLTEGSCLQTNRGNVTFNGSLAIGVNSDTGLIPCTTNTTQNPHPWFSIKSEVGNVDITLSAETTSVILDASTNSGKINGGDFNLNIQQNSDGSASYNGPLIAGTSPTATLVLGVSTGNISLHKGA
ncbi:MAG TPA: hypothetical protein VKB35_19045, partial [Ktedonobacteraceae bacterium]|nr:hypothetical protein [Ktedonobacteraceae bacterium]